MSQHSQILAELGYKQRSVRAYQDAGIRSDGQPFASRANVSAQKRASRDTIRRIEDIKPAKELGISLQELRGAL